MTTKAERLCGDEEQVKRYLALVQQSMEQMSRYMIPTPDGKPYLERFDLRPRKAGQPGTYLHIIYASDEDRDPHDHPFDFDSKIVFGAYEETEFEVGCISPAHVGTARVAGKMLCTACGMEATKPYARRTRVYREGDINVKKAEQLHQLKIIDGPVITLVRRGPKIREWGFQTYDGWVHHKPYIEAKFPGAQPTELND
jgi:hypothetical protein